MFWFGAGVLSNKNQPNEKEDARLSGLLRAWPVVLSAPLSPGRCAELGTCGWLVGDPGAGAGTDGSPLGPWQPWACGCPGPRPLGPCPRPGRRSRGCLLPQLTSAPPAGLDQRPPGPPAQLRLASLPSHSPLPPCHHPASVECQIKQKAYK